ncbi:hypothetical protein Dimus_018495, partial [Dionaea muscipula]
ALCRQQGWYTQVAARCLLSLSACSSVWARVEGGGLLSLVMKDGAAVLLGWWWSMDYWLTVLGEMVRGGVLEVWAGGGLVLGWWVEQQAARHFLAR